MKKLFLFCLISVSLIGCGKQNPYEPQEFITPPEVAEPENTSLVPDEETSVIVIDPFVNLQQRHPELFE